MIIPFISIAVIWLLGWSLSYIEWTEPTGEPITVTILQGNIVQKIKWAEDIRKSTMKWYKDKTEENLQSKIIIWPETAIPSSKPQIPNYFEELENIAHTSNIDILVGSLDGDQKSFQYYNTIQNIRGGSYKKRHLVPFGEYFPWPNAPMWIQRYLRFPMSDNIPGPEYQPLLHAAGQPIGSSICFEIAYPDEIRKSLPEATILVNASNDAPYRNSTEPHQHHQIARMRALETGRYLIRSVNTGFSAIIDPKGNTTTITNLFEEAALSGEVVPYKGATPYVLYGDKPLIIFMVVVSIFLLNDYPVRSA